MSDRRTGLDFRQGMIRKRLQNVKKVLLVLSGKGGVGKSVVSAAIAGTLANSGDSVGLMDADIYGPSSALLLDAHAPPKEGERGLTPPVMGGVKIMSVDLFASGQPLPLTGQGATQVILEMLALTEWGDLDHLIVDMPPATGDIMMTFTSFGKEELAAVVVTMPDRLSLAVAHRVLQLLKSGRIEVVGVLGNMHRRAGRYGTVDDDGPRRLANEFDVPFLGKLPYDSGVPKAVEASDIRSLLRTRFARSLRKSMGPYLDGSGLSDASLRASGERRSRLRTRQR